MPRWQKLAIEVAVYSPICGAYIELFAGLPLDVSFEQTCICI